MKVKRKREEEEEQERKRKERKGPFQNSTKKAQNKREKNNTRMGARKNWNFILIFYFLKKEGKKGKQPR